MDEKKNTDIDLLQPLLENILSKIDEKTLQEVITLIQNENLDLTTIELPEIGEDGSLSASSALQFAQKNKLPLSTIFKVYQCLAAAKKKA